MGEDLTINRQFSNRSTARHASGCDGDGGFENFAIASIGHALYFRFLVVMFSGRGRVMGWRGEIAARSLGSRSPRRATSSRKEAVACWHDEPFAQN